MPLICQINRIEKLTKLPRVIVEGSESLQVSNKKDKYKIERPLVKTTLENDCNACRIYIFFIAYCPIDLSRIILQCARTIESERGWGGHFHAFSVFFFDPEIDSVPSCFGMRERSMIIKKFLIKTWRVL